ncbi:MAG: hypothetical protein Q4E13_14330 [Clostridia bacterium]|nr:hypothetical protein [Clostridia bacterium]
MKRTMSLLLALLLIVFGLSGCQSNSDVASAEATKLSFADSASIDVIQSLDGKAVTLTGYMATLSPLSGDYIYLMNLPYQSCPFCVPNTQQLANTMAVYAASGSTFDYTDRPVQITGKLEMGDFTDDYGYEYNYRIVDAKYDVVDLSEVSAEYALYQALAEDGVIADVNSMFDYLLFVCQWTDYMGSGTDEDGNDFSYYLYPGDVQQILANDGLYGYAAQASEDYFPTLIQSVKAVSATELADLVQIITDAQALEQYARSELDSGNYQYLEDADQYELINGEDLYNQFYEVYLRFSDWLTKYEL